MDIQLLRKWKKPGYTIGQLYIDGDYICDTLEDTDRGLTSAMTPAQVRARKVKGQTAIPTGLYPVRRTWSPKFKRMLPLIERVAGYDGIRIHSGNTARDTDGCILPGMNTKAGMVTYSRNWFAVVDGKIEEAVRKGDKIWIRIM